MSPFGLVLSAGKALAVLALYATRESLSSALRPPPPMRRSPIVRRAVRAREPPPRPTAAIAVPIVGTPTASALAVAPPDAGRERPIDVRIEVSPPAADVAELVRAVRRDAGCAVPSGPHDACHAARSLGGRALDGETVRALESTVLQSGRPVCVQRAAIETLSDARSAEAKRALLRMRHVVEERAAWEGDPGPVLSLLRALPGAR